MRRKNIFIQMGSYKIYLMVIIFLCLSSTVNAATYYVDFVAGNNSNNGTSQSTPWKNIPGTCTVESSNANLCTYVTASGWVKINAGDTIKLKSGTTHNSTVGGEIRFLSTHYGTSATLGSPLTIIRDATWGSGAVTFDGTGITFPSGGGWGLIHTQVGGLKLEGATDNGIVIQNSTESGVSVYGASNIVGAFIYHVKFYNNGTGTPDTDTAAARGDIKFDDVTGGVIQHCYIDGNNKYQNGIVMGDSGKKADGVLVDNTVIVNHVCGNADAGDWGIGIKSLSSVLTVSNSTLANNFKGADNGDKTSGFSPILKYINNNIYNNVESGLNVNGGYVVGVTNPMTAYIINNVIRDNGFKGSYLYGANLYLYIVGNIYDGNGGKLSYESSNLSINPNSGDPGTVRAYLYNNVFYKPAGNYNFANNVWLRTSSPPSDLNIYSDYNSWVQRSGESAFGWALFGGSDETTNFSYGASGPGHASGNWYNWYGGSTTPPPNGSRGHYHQDSHSKGTGAADARLPPFANVINHDYRLTASYPGTNLSTQPWYIREMGLDRTGKARINWDMGAYEYVGIGGNIYYPAPPLNLLIN